MKKSFLIVAACIVFGNVPAQIGFGLKGGLNISTVKFTASYEGDFNTVAGFYVGPFANVNLSGKFAIQPSLLLSRQGYSYDHPSLNADPKFENMYLNVPVILLYSVIDNLKVGAGPQLGFRMSSKGGLEGDTEDTKELFKKTDVGLKLALSYVLANRLIIETGYNFGLANISENPADGVESIKNRVFSVGIGYVIK